MQRNLQLGASALLTLVAFSFTGVGTAALARDFKMALPGYKFDFPADHGSHDQFKTEWWYYTGHLQADGGREFGFELTFFRTATEIANGLMDSPWSVDNIYLAHMAISDLKAGKFFFDEKMSRAAFGRAGASGQEHRVWIENWSATSEGRLHLLRAKSHDYALALSLRADKDPVVHGKDGVSQKAACAGCASHYYSISRLAVCGKLTASGVEHKVSGQAWMDHEFGSNQLSGDQVGWDWFSIQLADGTDLMLYVMRRLDGSHDSNASGTLVGADGKVVHLKAGDYSIQATGSWHSPKSGGNYPMGWVVKVPDHKLDLTVQPALEDQELTTEKSTNVSYWEGACTVRGKAGGKPAAGKAYVEMTGYAEKFEKGI